MLVQGHGLVLQGSEDHVLSGRVLSSMEDLNGDGRNELVIGEPRAVDYRGAIRLIYGQAQSSWHALHDTTSSLSIAEVTTLSIVGASMYDMIGNSFTVAEDMDGDALPELVVGCFF